MKEKEITIRGKSTVIQYELVSRNGFVQSVVEWGNGNQTTFYKGMYTPGVWFAKDIPQDLIDLMAEIFDSEEPTVSNDYRFGYRE